MIEGGAGRRSPAEIATLHAHRVAKAEAWFAENCAAVRLCPICGYEGPFSPVRFKPAIWCPGCDSRPRHRLAKLWMDREMRLPPGARVVHFAAEPWVRAEMAARGARYVTADLNDRFELRLDLEALDLADGSVDLLIAHHVLEHVDDARALPEIGRVLSETGMALLTVPLVEGWAETLEGAHLGPEARARQLGDPDHLRFYGRDFRDRLARAGLAVREFAAIEPDVSTHALHRGERLFIAQRQARAAPGPTEPRGAPHG